MSFGETVLWNGANTDPCGLSCQMHSKRYGTQRLRTVQCWNGRHRSRRGNAGCICSRSAVCIPLWLKERSGDTTAFEPQDEPPKLLYSRSRRHTLLCHTHHDPFSALPSQPTAAGESLRTPRRSRIDAAALDARPRRFPVSATGHVPSGCLVREVRLALPKLIDNGGIRSQRDDSPGAGADGNMHFYGSGTAVHQV